MHDSLQRLHLPDESGLIIHERAAHLCLLDLYDDLIRQGMVKTVRGGSKRTFHAVSQETHESDLQETHRKPYPRPMSNTTSYQSNETIQMHLNAL